MFVGVSILRGGVVRGEGYNRTTTNTMMMMMMIRPIFDEGIMMMMAIRPWMWSSLRYGICMRKIYFVCAFLSSFLFFSIVILSLAHLGCQVWFCTMPLHLLPS